MQDTEKTDGSSARSGRRWPIWLAAGLAVLLAAGGTAWLLWPEPDAEAPASRGVLPELAKAPQKQWRKTAQDWWPQQCRGAASGTTCIVGAVSDGGGRPVLGLVTSGSSDGAEKARLLGVTRSDGGTRWTKDVTGSVHSCSTSASSFVCILRPSARERTGLGSPAASESGYRLLVLDRSSGRQTASVPLPRADYGLLPLKERVVVLGREVGSNPEAARADTSGTQERGPSPTLVAVVSPSGALAWRTQVSARVRSDQQEAVVRDEVLYVAGAQTPGWTALALGLADGAAKKGPAGYVVPTSGDELVTQQAPGAMLRRGDETLPGTSVRVPHSYADRGAVPLLLGQDDESVGTVQDPATKPYSFNAVDNQQPSSTQWSSKGMPLAACGNRVVTFRRASYGDEGTLAGLDTKDGSTRWTRASVMQRVACSGSRLVVMEAGRMLALSLETGRVEWTLNVPGGPCDLDVRHDPDLLICGSGDTASGGQSAGGIAVRAFAPTSQG